MKNKIKKIIFKIKVINNNIFCKLNKKNFKYKVGIVSCDEWINKVKEDVCLKIALNKELIDAELISWQDKEVDYDKFNMLIVRSIWGYQDYIFDFIEWLKKIKEKKIHIYNNPDIILSNLNKYDQFKLLDKYKIPYIETVFLKKEELYKIKDLKTKYKDIVIKPIISGSGENTYVISDTINKNNIKEEEIEKKYNKVLNKINNYVMVQPYIKEIKNGELSIVVVRGNISHAAIRYVNVFENKNMIKLIKKEELDIDAIKVVKKCININEYKEYLYMRVDLIKVNEEYKVMELELVEPHLFLEYDKKGLKNFSTTIKSIIKNSQL